MSACPTAALSCSAGRHAEDAVDAGGQPRPVGLQFVERAGGDQAFQRALVDDLRVDAPAEIGEVAERLVAARRDQVLDRLRADALDRGQRIEDAALAVPSKRRRTRRPSG